MFTWYWVADLCAAEGITFVLGHALAMKAIHGRKATARHRDRASRRGRSPRTRRSTAIPAQWLPASSRLGDVGEYQARSGWQDVDAAAQDDGVEARVAIGVGDGGEAGRACDAVARGSEQIAAKAGHGRDAAEALGTTRTTDTVHAALRDVVARRRRAWLARRDFSELEARLPELRAPREVAATAEVGAS